MINNSKLSRMIESVMQQAQTPGLALGIVHKDQIIFEQGFGFRDVERQLPVDSHTLFPIGSSTKAFLGAAYAKLSSLGNIDLDEPVQERVADFHLSDKLIAMQVTWRDMLSHQTGMPRHEFVWIPENLTSEVIVERMAHLPLSAGLRQTFQYCNLMYVAASHFLPEISGLNYADFMAQHFFEPLTMSRTYCSLAAAIQQDNFAYSYDTTQPQAKKLPPMFRDNILGAGSIVSNVHDMCQWLITLMNGHSTLPASVIDECIRPNCFTSLGIVNFVPNQRDALNAGYGLGWCNEIYRGHRFIHHGGSINGYNALVAFLPDQEYGFVCLHNHYHLMVHKAIVLSAIDQLLDLPQKDWATTLLPIMGQYQQQAGLAKAHESPLVAKPPTHDLSDYAGEYHHPGYGTLRIDAKVDHLTFQFGDYQCVMKHVHYNTFQVEFASFNLIENLSFHISTHGDIDHLTLVTDPALPAAQFIRQAKHGLDSAEYLQPFVGDYEINGITVSISMQQDHLVLHQPDGQNLALKAVAENVFEIVLSPEVRLTFNVDAQVRVQSFSLQQHGQLITAARADCVLSHN